MIKTVTGAIVLLVVLVPLMNNITYAVSKSLGLTGKGDDAAFAIGIVIAIALTALIVRKFAGRNRN